MRKNAQFANLWPQIYRKLKSPPPGVNLGNFPGKLPPMNKIIIDPGRLQGNSQAVGYVTTEDVDQNGSLDTIHIASPRLEEAMNTAGVPLQGVQNLDQLSNEELIRLLTPFVELFSHEMGHLQDFKPGQENPFPGGESAAESVARSAVQPISLATTNNRNRFEKAGSFKMNLKLMKILANLGNKLDRDGNTKVADYVDEMINKYSQKLPGDVDYESVFNKQMPEQTVERSAPLAFNSGTPRPKVPAKGNIQPYKDPYTYNFDPTSKTFTVATTPPGKEFAIGRKIVPGDKGYQQLFDEAESEGLATSATPPQYPGGHYPKHYPGAGPEPTIENLATKLGLASVQGLVPENIDPFILAKKKIFTEAMARIADEIIGSAGMFGSSAEAALKQNANVLKNPNITGSQAIGLFNTKILPELLISAGQQVADQIRNEFDERVNAWQGVEDALKLKQLLEEQQLRTERNLADDGQEQTEVQKTAALKDEYQKIFWFDAKNPFNRSNAAFKR